MKVKLRTGMDKLVFGMKEKDVRALYGDPDKKLIDDEENTIYLYNDKKLRLTFYKEEDNRLGYVISSNPELQLNSLKIIGEKWAEVSGRLKGNELSFFEQESFDSVDNYFNEDNWIIFQVEFGQIIRVELGAIINDKDEFDWKFKS